MKKRILLSLGAALIATACQSNQTAQTKKIPQAFQAALIRVWEGQAKMQAALSRDDLKKAKEEFQSLHASLHMMPVDDLDSGSQAYWDSVDAQIMAILHPFAASENLDSAKLYSKAFGDLLVPTLQRFDLSSVESSAPGR